MVWGELRGHDAGDDDGIACHDLARASLILDLDNNASPKAGKCERSNKLVVI